MGVNIGINISCSALFVLMLHQAIGQQCSPPIVLPSDQLHGDLTEIVCIITSVSVCTSDLKYMVFQKQSHLDDTWGSVAEIEKMGSTNFPTLGNGYSLNGRASGDEVIDIYTLRIFEAEPEDSGMWRCNVEKNDGSVHLGEQLNMDVSSNRAQVTIERIEPSDFMVTKPNRYRCFAENVSPMILVIWEIGGKQYTNDTVMDTKLIYTWQIERYITLAAYDIGGVEVKCLLVKDEGRTWSVENSTIPELEGIQKPALIESDGVTGTSELESGTEMNISCTASGTSVSIDWKYNDGALSKLINVNTYNITGDFSFGQKIATISTLTWTSNCENVDSVVGQYICLAQGLQNTQSISESFIVRNNCGLEVWEKALIGTFSCIGVGALICCIIGGIYYCYKKQYCCFVKVIADNDKQNNTFAISN